MKRTEPHNTVTTNKYWVMLNVRNETQWINVLFKTTNDQKKRNVLDANSIMYDVIYKPFVGSWKIFFVALQNPQKKQHTTKLCVWHLVPRVPGGREHLSGVTPPPFTREWGGTVISRLVTFRRASAAKTSLSLRQHSCKWKRIVQLNIVKLVEKWRRRRRLRSNDAARGAFLCQFLQATAHRTHRLTCGSCPSEHICHPPPSCVRLEETGIFSRRSHSFPHATALCENELTLIQRFPRAKPFVGASASHI